MNGAPASSVPDFVQALLWGVDLAQFDPHAHADFLLERIFERGRPETYRWAREFYGVERLKQFLRESGVRRLSSRALNFWTLMLEVEERECLLTHSLQNRTPLWPH